MLSHIKSHSSKQLLKFFTLWRLRNLTKLHSHACTLLLADIDIFFSVQYNAVKRKITYFAKESSLYNLQCKKYKSISQKTTIDKWFAANLRPMRIPYKCLVVPIYAFPEVKLRSLVISKTELYCSVFQFLHSYISKRSIYSQDRK
jgi:hypothetical protein